MANPTVLITGNTYPVKDTLRSLGGHWDPGAKGWRVPADKAEQALALVASAPKSSTRSSAPRRRRWNEDDECELCGKNKYSCGHCIGW